MNPNQQQRDVIEHVDGPCLVTAVPGSGKTTSITERTKNLLRLGKSPSSILAITFTNKAANEMKVRIAKVIGADIAKKMTICTFHALCARIIRENAALVGLKSSYTIYDSDEQERFVKLLIRRVEGPDYKIPDVYWQSTMAYLEGIRNACLQDEEARNKFGITGNQVQVVSSYAEALRASNAIDFTGLLSETNRMMDENSSVRERYSKKWQYISVDEVQDTNIAQYKLIKHLCSTHNNIVCVGDVDQSIFAFRNASPENVLLFEKEFGAKVLKLETNYRSTPEILRSAQSLIVNNKLRKDTVLKTDNPAGDIPRIILVEEEQDMAEEMACEVQRKIRSGINPNEIAILYRTNFVSRVIEMQLRARQIKYKVIGGQSFWDRKEVKYAMAILKFLNNPNDKLAFEKSIEACCRGVGPKTIMDMTDRAEANGSKLLDVLYERAEGNGVQAGPLTSFANVMKRDMRPYDALRALLAETSFGDKLDKDSTSENDRRANVEEVAVDLQRFMNTNKSLSSYLQDLSLASSTDEDGVEGEVKLMTMHACKGLEFDVVLISHAIDGIIPHVRTLQIENEAERERQLEEERRLMYVAMTRARKVLRIYFCSKRAQKEDLLPSRFLKETGIGAFRIKRQ